MHSNEKERPVSQEGDDSCGETLCTENCTHPLSSTVTLATILRCAGDNHSRSSTHGVVRDVGALSQYAAKGTRLLTAAVLGTGAACSTGFLQHSVDDECNSLHRFRHRYRGLHK